jgi:hypothetical protein
MFLLPVEVLSYIRPTWRCVRRSLFTHFAPAFISKSKRNLNFLFLIVLLYYLPYGHLLHMLQLLSKVTSTTSVPVLSLVCKI